MTTVFPTYRIFTDATADLNAALTSGLPTIEVIPMSVEIGGQHFSYGRPGDLDVYKRQSLFSARLLPCFPS